MSLLFSNLVNHIEAYSTEADFDRFEMNLVLAYGKTLSNDEFKQLIEMCEAHLVWTPQKKIMRNSLNDLEK